MAPACWDGGGFQGDLGERPVPHLRLGPGASGPWDGAQPLVSLFLDLVSCFGVIYGSLACWQMNRMISTSQ